MKTFGLLGFAAMSVIVGSVAAGAAPPAPELEFAFEETVTLAPGLNAGESAIGPRSIVPITGGHFEGPEIRGEVLPGGWDWQLLRRDGCLQIKADYMLKTDDGVIINVINQGVACAPVNGVPSPVRTQAVFEVPQGKYDWLSRSAFIGTLVPGADRAEPAVVIRFYRVK